jgi:hypothetical protein
MAPTLPQTDEDVSFVPTLHWISGPKGKPNQAHSQKEVARGRREQIAVRERKVRKAAVDSCRSSFAAPGRVSLVGTKSGSMKNEKDDAARDYLNKCPLMAPKTLLSGGKRDPFCTWTVSEPNMDAFVNKCMLDPDSMEHSIDTSSFGCRLPHLWSFK